MPLQVSADVRRPGASVPHPDNRGPRHAWRRGASFRGDSRGSLAEDRDRLQQRARQHAIGFQIATSTLLDEAEGLLGCFDHVPDPDDVVRRHTAPRPSE